MQVVKQPSVAPAPLGRPIALWVAGLTVVVAAGLAAMSLVAIKAPEAKAPAPVIDASPDYTPDVAASLAAPRTAVVGTPAVLDVGAIGGRVEVFDGNVRVGAVNEGGGRILWTPLTIGAHHLVMVADGAGRHGPVGATTVEVIAPDQRTMALLPVTGPSVAGISLQTGLGLAELVGATGVSATGPLAGTRPQTADFAPGPALTSSDRVAVGDLALVPTAPTGIAGNLPALRGGLPAGETAPMPSAATRTVPGCRSAVDIEVSPATAALVHIVTAAGDLVTLGPFIGGAGTVPLPPRSASVIVAATTSTVSSATEPMLVPNCEDTGHQAEELTAESFWVSGLGDSTEAVCFAAAGNDAVRVPRDGSVPVLDGRAELSGLLSAKQGTRLNLLCAGVGGTNPVTVTGMSTVAVDGASDGPFTLRWANAAPQGVPEATGSEAERPTRPGRRPGPNGTILFWSAAPCGSGRPCPDSFEVVDGTGAVVATAGAEDRSVEIGQAGCVAIRAITGNQILGTSPASCAPSGRLAVVGAVPGVPMNVTRAGTCTRASCDSARHAGWLNLVWDPAAVGNGVADGYEIVNERGEPVRTVNGRRSVELYLPEGGCVAVRAIHRGVPGGLSEPVCGNALAVDSLPAMPMIATLSYSGSTWTGVGNCTGAPSPLVVLPGLVTLARPATVPIQQGRTSQTRNGCATNVAGSTVAEISFEAPAAAVGDLTEVEVTQVPFGDNPICPVSISRAGAPTGTTPLPGREIGRVGTDGATIGLGNEIDPGELVRLVATVTGTTSCASGLQLALVVREEQIELPEIDGEDSEEGNRREQAVDGNGQPIGRRAQNRANGDGPVWVVAPQGTRPDGPGHAVAVSAGAAMTVTVKGAVQDASEVTAGALRAQPVTFTVAGDDVRVVAVATATAGARIVAPGGRGQAPPLDPGPNPEAPTDVDVAGLAVVAVGPEVGTCADQFTVSVTGPAGGTPVAWIEGPLSTAKPLVLTTTADGWTTLISGATLDAGLWTVTAVWDNGAASQASLRVTECIAPTPTTRGGLDLGDLLGL